MSIKIPLPPLYVTGFASTHVQFTNFDGSYIHIGNAEIRTSALPLRIGSVKAEKPESIKGSS